MVWKITFTTLGDLPTSFIAHVRTFKTRASPMVYSNFLFFVSLSDKYFIVSITLCILNFQMIPLLLYSIFLTFLHVK